MRELKKDEVSQVAGGAVPLAALVVKGATWVIATVGGATAAYYAKEYVSNS
ncbi:MAG: class IIb bacteriocin, lactobin A/cerein 7B family [Pseudohongiella sp.]|nr:class IIb bacteriocin, lactobin A/cerein 7B family [Pseudohongiella sp.]MDP2128220.1 class IIb bacteriocin, lactobin A/cerein 7B family [Pseudohongiella sp.]